MRRRGRLLFVFSIVAALGMGLLVLRGTLNSRETSGRASTVLIDIPVEDIRQIHVSGPHGELVLENDGSRFVPESSSMGSIGPDAIRLLVAAASTVIADRVVADSMSDASSYGLSDGFSQMTVTLENGEIRGLKIGDQSPTGMHFYASLTRDERIYLVPAKVVRMLGMATVPEPTISVPMRHYRDIQYLRLLNPHRTVEIVEEISGAVDTGSRFATRYLLEPYLLPRPVAEDRFQRFVSRLRSLLILKKVDSTGGIEPFGLSRPTAELELVDERMGRLHLLFGGTGPEGGVYVKLADEETVFLADFNVGALAVSPFELVEPFVMLVDISNLEQLLIEGGGTSFQAVVRRSSSASSTVTYQFEGSKIPEDEFKNFYARVIGLRFDAERPDPIASVPPATAETIKITFDLVDSSQEAESLHLVPYNSNFYAVFVNNVSEFLVSRSQVHDILRAAQELTKRG